MSALKKARIYDPENVNDGFYVQFNPHTLQYAVGTNSRGKKSGGNGEQHTQVQGDPTGCTGLASLSATLFFHTYQNEAGYTDVRKEVNRLRAFLRRRDDREGVISRGIAFAWGTLTVIGTLESISVSYQMFAADGTPVQAEVTVTILGEDPDVKADGVNRAASQTVARDPVLAWREQGVPPPSVQWLFELF